MKQLFLSWERHSYFELSYAFIRKNIYSEFKCVCVCVAVSIFYFQLNISNEVDIETFLQVQRMKKGGQD